MPKQIDESGKRFNRLVVIECVGKKYYSGKPRRIWLCQCDCGNTLITPITPLKLGRTKSCGCMNSENRRLNYRKHGMSSSRVFHIWANMLDRCNNPNSPRYQDYGGRGITVCDEWIDENGSTNFINWALSNGYSNNLTLDRIDNDKGYSPQNCRWVDNRTQQRNKRTNRLIDYQNETHCLKEWSEILNIKYTTLQTRLRNGWSVEKAFQTPISKSKGAED